MTAPAPNTPTGDRVLRTFLRLVAERGIEATTIYNCFDVDAPPGDRTETRQRLGVGPEERGDPTTERREASDGRTIPVVNPATEETLCEVACATASDVESAVAGAQRAFGSAAHPA